MSKETQKCNGGGTVYFDFIFKESSLILAALSHLHRSKKNGENLGYLSEIINEEEIDLETIDKLCEKINFEATVKTHEEYKVVALSTAHLTKKDTELLTEAISSGETMVLERDSGFFIKLYPGEDIQNYRHGHSESIKKVIKWASQAGYQMIEFDRDADIINQFETFDW